MGIPLPPIFLKSSFIIRFWSNFVWNIFIWVLFEDNEKIYNSHKWEPLSFPPHSQNFIMLYYPISMHFCMKHLYLDVGWKLQQNLKKIKWGDLSPGSIKF